MRLQIELSNHQGLLARDHVSRQLRLPEQNNQDRVSVSSSRQRSARHHLDVSNGEHETSSLRRRGQHDATVQARASPHEHGRSSERLFGQHSQSPATQLELLHQLHSLVRLGRLSPHRSHTSRGTIESTHRRFDDQLSEPAGLPSPLFGHSLLDRTNIILLSCHAETQHE